MKKIERALLSVSDKTGIIEFATGLHELGVELLSTGGTASAIRDAGIPVKDISEFTGFPEMLDGRVKTLHPNVHAGLLYLRGNTEHEATMQAHNLKCIDLVCVNLYPFESTIAKPDVTFEDAIENIDIGGPTMIRSAAKNMRHVTVVTDPTDYGMVLDAMRENHGDTTESQRIKLGQKVFARVAEYNAAIANYLADQIEGDEETRPFVLAYSDATTLRYGENPHQQARLYTATTAVEACIAHTEQLHGKEMSFNNYVDGHASLEAARELAGEPGVSIIKHTNPCGYATGKSLVDAMEAAWAGDPVSAFGSVITCTVPVDMPTAEFLKGRFVEVVIAPDFDAEAAEFLREKSKSIRLLKLKHPFVNAKPSVQYRQIGGGLLVQDRDIELTAKWECVTERPFAEDMNELALFGVKACKHVKSNAILLVRRHENGGCQVIGMGAGQPNRVDSVKKLAIARAKENIALMHEAGAGNGCSLEELENQVLGECVLISDAFFPFPDNIEAAAAAGIRYIVEPGGSVKDDDVIAACNELGVAMILTGMRHFLH